jgi:hypothetical protein
MTTQNAAQMLDEGVRISTGGPKGESAKVGRAYMKRIMPV